jgi:hypothetical protein
VNADGELNIADAIHTISYLFLFGPLAGCQDSADANDDGAIGLSDAIFVLGHLFSLGDRIPPPVAGCGIDPTPDRLACEEYAPCQ